MTVGVDVFFVEILQQTLRSSRRHRAGKLNGTVRTEDLGASSQMDHAVDSMSYSVTVTEVQEGTCTVLWVFPPVAHSIIARMS